MIYGEYHDDNGVVWALLMGVNTFEIQGFWGPLLGTPRRPNVMHPRYELFVSWLTGKQAKLPYPTTTPPHSLGAFVTIAGDFTYAKLASVSEIRKGEST